MRGTNPPIGTLTNGVQGKDSAPIPNRLKMKPVLFSCCLLLATDTARPAFSLAVGQNPIKSMVRDISIGYQSRITADPSFAVKSVTEVLLAAGTQFAAEYERRGSNLVAEMDFVTAGILTAIFGKYYSMWRVAPTKLGKLKDKSQSNEPMLFGMEVPTNAFQKTMLDGETVPSIQQRMASFLVPVVPLFRSGFIASTLGYGFTAVMILLRSKLIPSFVQKTQNVNILYASLYTGLFMAVVSNIRYQLLQGLIEPFLDNVLRQVPLLRAAAIFATRIANGLLGSALAISGMKMLGLQRLQ